MNTKLSLLIGVLAAVAVFGQNNETPNPCLVDLMIVMDVSSSTTDDNGFVNAKNLMVNLLTLPSVAWYEAGRLNVGLVKFTDKAQLMLPMQGVDRQTAIDTVAQLPTEGGLTSVKTGMELAFKEMQAHAQPGSTKVLVLVSDGRSGPMDDLESTRQLGEQMKNAGINVFAITLSTNAFEDGLLAYTGSIDRVYRADRGQVAITTFVNELETITRNVPACGLLEQRPSIVPLEQVGRPPSPPPQVERPPIVPPQYNPCKVDLMIVMDVSTSILEDTDFVNEKNFIIDVLKFPSPAWYYDGRLNVGIIKFTKTAQLVLPFSGTRDNEEAVRIMTNLTSEGGETSAMSGILLALDQIHKYRRPDAQVVLLFVSDGISGPTDPISEMKSLGKKVKDEGIIGFSMTFSHDAFEDELVAYAGDKNRVYRGDQSEEELANFRADLRTITRNLELCGPPPPLPPPAVKPDDFADVGVLQPVSTSEGGGKCPIDVMILVDTSDKDNLDAYKKSLIESLDWVTDEDLQDRVKVSIVSFGRVPVMETPFIHGSKAFGMSLIDGIEYSGGRSNASAAVELAVSEILVHHRAKAYILFFYIGEGRTDGNITKLEQISEHMRTVTGANVFAGTHHANENVGYTELTAIAGAENHVYYVGTPDRKADLVSDIATIVNYEPCLYNILNN